MSSQQNVFEELNYRLENEIKNRKSKFDNTVNAAWRGYLAAVLEWGIIKVDEFDKLNNLLPPLENDPSLKIFSGYC